MKSFLTAVLAFALLITTSHAAEKLDLKDQKDRESYSLGYQFGKNIKSQEFDLNMDVYTAGIRDALTDARPQLEPDEIRSTIMGVQARLTAVRQKELQETAEKNLAEGKAFMEEYAKKAGVKTRPSGLQYRVLAEGTGETAKTNDEVTVQYRGSFINGTEFDSSYKRRQPVTFTVDKVIAGWQEALQSMNKGSKWQLVVPPELAYGSQTAGPVPPNSTLVFEVELVSINRK